MNDLYYSIFFLNIVVYFKKKKLHAKIETNLLNPHPCPKRKKNEKRGKRFSNIKMKEI